MIAANLWMICALTGLTVADEAEKASRAISGACTRHRNELLSYSYFTYSHMFETLMNTKPKDTTTEPTEWDHQCNDYVHRVNALEKLQLIYKSYERGCTEHPHVRVMFCTFHVPKNADCSILTYEDLPISCPLNIPQASKDESKVQGESIIGDEEDYSVSSYSEEDKMTNAGSPQTHGGNVHRSNSGGEESRMEIIHNSIHTSCASNTEILKSYDYSGYAHLYDRLRQKTPQAVTTGPTDWDKQCNYDRRRVQALIERNIFFLDNKEECFVDPEVEVTFCTFYIPEGPDCQYIAGVWLPVACPVQTQDGNYEALPREYKNDRGTLEGSHVEGPTKQPRKHHFRRWLNKKETGTEAGKAKTGQA